MLIYAHGLFIIGCVLIGACFVRIIATIENHHIDYQPGRKSFDELWRD